MMEDSLYKFYTSLIPNVVSELFFYIPKDKIPDEILRNNSVLRSGLVLDKVFVFDPYSGPVPYVKDKNYNGFLSQGSNLEKNAFSLVNKKGEVSEDSFNFLIDKYVTFVQSVLELSNWMNDNLGLYFNSDDKLKGYFNMQCFNLNRHIASIEASFNKKPIAVPLEELIKSDKIEAFLKDADQSFSRKDLTREDLLPIQKTGDNKGSQKKKPLITEAEAEEILLKTYFGINKNS